MENTTDTAALQDEVLKLKAQAAAKSCFWKGFWTPIIYVFIDAVLVFTMNSLAALDTIRWCVFIAMVILCFVMAAKKGKGPGVARAVLGLVLGIVIAVPLYICIGCTIIAGVVAKGASDISAAMEEGKTAALSALQLLSTIA